MSESEPQSLRVEVADAGGTVVELPQRIAESLCKLGVEATVVPLERVVGTRADAVILRGDAPGVLSVLRSLRDDGERPDTPILLLGTPEGTGPFEEGPGFGAEHVLPKDASAARIVEALWRITRRSPAPQDPAERRVEHTMELSKAGDWRTQAVGPMRPPPVPPEEPRQISEIVPSPELSAVFESPGDTREPRRRVGSSPGEPARSESVAPGTGSGVSSPGTGSGSVPGTSQLFVVASISDDLRKILYDADRRVFPDRPPIDVSLPRGEDAARDLVPDEFVEVLSLALDEPERVDLELTFVGAAAPRHEDRAHGQKAPEPPPERPDPRDGHPVDGEVEPDARVEHRPRTSPGTPTSMSRRPPAPEGETRSAADAVPAARPHVREDVARASRPPPSPVVGPAERGELVPLGALALLGQLAIGRLDVTLALRVHDKPVILALARGELIGASGAGWTELRRRALHRVLETTMGAGRATEASRGEPTFSYERATRIADDTALAEVLADAQGAFSLEPRTGELGPRLTQRSLPPTLLELSRVGLSPDRVSRFYLREPEDPMVSRFERLGRLEVARLPTLERVLDTVEAPRELAWLLRRETASSTTSLGALLALAPDEPGLVGAVFCIAQLGGLAVQVTTAPASLAHTDLDARAEKAIVALRGRADRADYFEVLGIPRDSDGARVVEAHYRLRGELLAWPLADLGLARLEPDRVRILSVLDDAAEILGDPRLRARYARGLSTLATPPPR